MIINDNGFIHHVFFWLKNTENNEDREALIKGLEQLIDGLKALSVVEEINNFHIGIPAKTNRDVVEKSYSVSWLLLFDSPHDQDVYQDHPVHLKFIKECSHLWSKVVVYDAINPSK